MATTRIHEIAKEFGVDSRLVLDKLRDLGFFVKSASSTVPLDAEMALRRGIDTAKQAGMGPQEWLATRRPGGPPPSKPHGKRHGFTKPKPRPTSWTGTDLAVSESLWRRAGLGDDGEPLARFLLDRGIFPDDLKTPIRGTAAVNRFRSGEASWHVLAAELKEARDAVTPPPRELPSTEVTRRLKGA